MTSLLCSPNPALALLANWVLSQCLPGPTFFLNFVAFVVPLRWPLFALFVPLWFISLLLPALRQFDPLGPMGPTFPDLVAAEVMRLTSRFQPSGVFGVSPHPLTIDIQHLNPVGPLEVPPVT